MAKPNGRLELPRRIKPGSELVRTWKRKTYRVMVMADGFAHDGKTFASLSEIASEITGTKWNGPRFFGLRTKTKESEEPAAPDRSDSAKLEAEATSVSSRPSGGSAYRKRNAAGTGKSDAKDSSHGH